MKNVSLIFILHFFFAWFISLFYYCFFARVTFLKYNAKFRLNSNKTLTLARIKRIFSWIFSLVFLYLKRTNFRVYLFSRVEKNCILRVFIFANHVHTNISRVLIFANRCSFEKQWIDFSSKKVKVFGFHTQKHKM